jgi:hypothetical protein
MTFNIYAHFSKLRRNLQCIFKILFLESSLSLFMVFPLADKEEQKFYSLQKKRLQKVALHVSQSEHFSHQLKTR